MIDAPSIFFGSALLPDGRVLFVGSDQPASQTMAELYDPGTGTFSRTGSMIDAHPNGLGSALLPDGRVLIAGGDDQGTAELYDPGTGTFSRTGSMTQALDVMSCTTLLDGRVLFTGSAVSLTSQSSAGPAGKGTGFALVDFRRGSSQAQQRPPVFALVPETMLAQVYDPKSGKFSAAGPMMEPRGEYTATLLPDGRVLIAGGETYIAELFDPATGKFELNGGCGPAVRRAAGGQRGIEARGSGAPDSLGFTPHGTLSQRPPGAHRVLLMRGCNALACGTLTLRSVQATPTAGSRSAALAGHALALCSRARGPVQRHARHRDALARSLRHCPWLPLRPAPRPAPGQWRSERASASR